ncbi:hypothetical protein EBH_0005860 [Eimeria brunetti]|uniref:Uncharacterized protein n=1 Tax=Eimeria brunetti TaxID=51314 RepID=U6LSB7_9EIME|nr:hypothetical protein EBH_0005860 [Eimeria brunetti]
MLRTSIQPDEQEEERLVPALELVYTATSRSPTELLPFDVMIGDDALTAADRDIESVMGRRPTRNGAGNMTDQYVLNYIVDQCSSFNVVTTEEQGGPLTTFPDAHLC